jgi:hypothetical protein
MEKSSVEEALELLLETRDKKIADLESKCFRYKNEIMNYKSAIKDIHEITDKRF